MTFKYSRRAKWLVASVVEAPRDRFARSSRRQNLQTAVTTNAFLGSEVLLVTDVLRGPSITLHHVRYRRYIRCSTDQRWHNDVMSFTAQYMHTCFTRKVAHEPITIMYMHFLMIEKMCMYCTEIMPEQLSVQL